MKLFVTITNNDTGTEITFEVRDTNSIVDQGLEVLLPISERSSIGDVSYIGEITVEGKELNALATIDHENHWGSVQFFDHTEASPENMQAILATIIEMI